MLKRHGGDARSGPASSNRAAVWYDLSRPTEGEIAEVEQATGIRMPSREQIASIEMSRRSAIENDMLHLHVPYFSNESNPTHSPLGLVVSPDFLVTIRYGDSAAFEHLAVQISSEPGAATGARLFLALMQGLVGQAADNLEGVIAETGELSGRVLCHDRRSTRLLNGILGEIGELENSLTRIHLSATGLERIVNFAQEHAPDWIDEATQAKLGILRRDLDSLGELDGHLTDKLQFLLDAALGFINIEQNEVMKLMTVASVVSAPPMILAGIWGMNFVLMPELKQPWGYPVALVAIVLSVVLPFLWFKRRGWL